MYEIRVWHCQNVVARYYPKGRAEAGELYFKLSQRCDQYVELRVSDVAYTTAQAWRHFDMEKEGADR